MISKIVFLLILTSTYRLKKKLIESFFGIIFLKQSYIRPKPLFAALLQIQLISIHYYPSK